MPGIIFLLMLYAATVAGVTAALVKLIGARLANRSRAMAFAVCGIVVPLGFAIWAAFQLFGPSTPGALDKRGIFGAICVVVEAITLPSSFVTSGLMLLRKSPAPGCGQSSDGKATVGT